MSKTCQMCENLQARLKQAEECAQESADIMRRARERADRYKKVIEDLLQATAWSHTRDGSNNIPLGTDVSVLLLQAAMIRAYREIGFKDEEIKDYFAPRAWKMLKEGIPMAGSKKVADG